MAPSSNGGDLTKPEIQRLLTEKGIKFKVSETKAKLLKRLGGE